jgi:glycosyltransferase involved in cell wall biosynthesis
MKLLFVVNFPANTGYAWNTIEAVFRRVGEQLVADGHGVTIAYSSLAGGPSAAMRGAPFEFIEFNYERALTPAGALGFARLLRNGRFDALYLTDRSTWAWQYPVFRLAGVRRLLVHDRTSGVRTIRPLAWRLVKRALHRPRLWSADCAIAVSDFVRQRLIHHNGIPPERVRLVYNGIDVDLFSSGAKNALRQLLDLADDVPIVFCSGRAHTNKGFQTLIDAAALLRDAGTTRVAFVYCGGGPHLEMLRQHARRLGLDAFFFLGPRSDISDLIRSATISVVPSLWAEAFGLTVVESMAAGVPVIASKTGGIPELVGGDGGVLVTPGDAEQLAAALQALLEQPARRTALAQRARAIATRFTIERAAENLYNVVAAALRSGDARHVSYGITAVPLPAAAEKKSNRTVFGS